MLLSEITEQTYKDYVVYLCGSIDNDESVNSYLRDLIAKSDSLANKEKPVMNGTMLDLATQEEYTCDLIWKKAKIIFLTAENEDIAPIIHNGGWTCFCSTIAGLTADEIIQTIPEV
jgi:hypothetical protein